MIEIEGLKKRFGQSIALDEVSMHVRDGAMYGFVGPNGAGKTTTIRCMMGLLAADCGKLLINGIDMEKEPKKALSQIGYIPDDFGVYDNLKVLEYMEFFASCYGITGLSARKRSMTLLDQVGLEGKSDFYVGSLSKGMKQRLCLARALVHNPSILIMDEPTASLSKQETEMLFNIVRKLKEEGTSIIYISHRMEEIFQITDRVTVMRDGKIIGTKETKDATTDWVTNSMLGKEVDKELDKKDRKTGEVLLDVKGLTKANIFQNISFQVHRGEIVVLSGLVGAGRTEVMRAIFGIDPYDSGEITFKGEPIKKHTWDVIQQGIVMVPEDRGRQGLVKEISAAENMVLAAFPTLSKHGFRDKKKEAQRVEEQVKGLLLNPPTAKLDGGSYSGGNQQKVVIGKWLNTDPELLILDEPTCGVDVGAKMEIYRLIIKLAEEGRGILIVSSDIEETQMIADRIIVMRQGMIAGELTEDFEKNAILGMALAGKEA